MMEKVAAFTAGLLAALNAMKGLLILALLLGAAAYALYRNPPFKPVGRGEIGLRINLFTGEVTEQREGSVLVLPLMHDLRVFALRDQVYRPPTAQADGPSPLQSLEGLSLGADISVRYAIDPARLRAVAASLPEDIAGQIVEPAVQGTIYKTFARYTVREIFSVKRAEIQQAIETELRTRLAADGLALRSVLVGKVDLPREYRRGMEALLDLALLERQHVLHRLFLRLGGDHRLARGGFGGLLAARLLGLAVERHLFHAPILELERVAHLLGGELLGE